MEMEKTGSLGRGRAPKVSGSIKDQKYRPAKSCRNQLSASDHWLLALTASALGACPGSPDHSRQSWLLNATPLLCLPWVISHSHSGAEWPGFYFPGLPPIGSWNFVPFQKLWLLEIPVCVGVQTPNKVSKEGPDWVQSWIRDKRDEPGEVSRVRSEKV